MHKRYIHACSCIFLDPENEKEDLVPVAAMLPPKAARRMSRLGIMLYNLLDKMPLNFATTLIYGTTFTEVSALQTYLDSFPYASPLAFQKSIHPGGIEQALILRHQEVGALLPLAGKASLLPQMLKCAFLSETPNTVLSGGEEQGGWLKGHGIAYDSSFAFAIHLSENAEGSIGTLEWEPESTQEDVALPSLEAAVKMFNERKPLVIDCGCHGRFSTHWK
jgi:hypothetical protein